MKCPEGVYIHTVKTFKFGQPKNCSKWLYHRVLRPKDADGMANSVDTDQTTPGLHCLLRPVCLKT